MTNWKHQNKMSGRQDIEMDEKAFDRQLGATLAKIAASEPRAGLEDRILANLRTAPVPSAGITWWMWPSVAITVIAVAIGASLLWRSRTPVNHMQGRTQALAKPETTLHREAKTVAASSLRNKFRRPSGIRKHDSEKRAISAVAALPKLDQFPSPQPPSQQEKALVQYVNQFPQDAFLVAQAQAEYEEEIQKKIRESESAEPRGSDE